MQHQEEGDYKDLLRDFTTGKEGGTIKVDLGNSWHHRRRRGGTIKLDLGNPGPHPDKNPLNCTENQCTDKS